MKRLFDFSLTLMGLLVAIPVVGLIAALMKLSSRGPVFYAQERVGFDGNVFTMYKFRTMVVDAESNGAQMAVSGDPRCTRMGSFLRRTSMDELPQLWNVLRGR